MSEDIFVDTSPIFIDTSNLVSFSATAVDAKIADALSKLSAAIASNGRVLLNLADRVTSLEARLEGQLSATKANIQDIKVGTAEISQRLETMSVQQSDLASVLASKSTALDDARNGLSELSNRLVDVEQGRCPSLVGVMAEEAERRVSLASSIISSITDRKIEDESALLKEHIEKVVDSQRKDNERRIELMGSQQKVSLGLLAQGHEERMGELNNQFVRSIRTVYRFLLKTYADDWSLQNELFCKAFSYLAQHASEINVLFSTLLMDRKACFDICGVSCLGTGRFPPEGETKFFCDDALFPLDGDLRSIETSVETLTNLISQEGSGLRDTVIKLEMGHLCERLDEHVNTDQKIAYWTQLPHNVRLRYLLQRETQDRLEILKSELQHDMVTELLDVQRELKNKVAVTKMSEILEHHRDEHLYETVKSVVSDLQDLRLNKVDISQFIDALKAKADLRALESKVETCDLSTQVDSINSNAERLGRDISRAFERNREIEGSLRNLQDFVLSGGGVYSAVAELNDKLASATSQLEFDGVIAGPPNTSWKPSSSRKSLVPQSPKREALKADEAEGPSPKGCALASMSGALGLRPTATKASVLLETLTKTIGNNGYDESDSFVVSTPVAPTNLTSSSEISLREAGNQSFLDSVRSSSSRPATGKKSNIRGRAGFVPSRPQSSDAVAPRAKINHHVSGGLLDKTRVAVAPSTVPMTSTQRDYCDSLGLDTASTLRVLQAATPCVTTKEARGTRPKE